jgi:hypothetical protein
MGLLLLLKGDYQHGWPMYEWRWRLKGYAQHSNPRPQWDGQALAGRRILLHAEQGFGDVIHLARYIPMVAERGGKMIVACPRNLHRLLRGLGPVEKWLGPQEPLPDHDLHCPWMSLPRVFETTLETIPAAIPYLSADPHVSRQWAARLPADGRLRVGLVWAGRRLPDRYRSIPADQLAPLGEIAGVHFVSLQKRQAAEQVLFAPPPLPLTDWSDDLLDFADTAALLHNLDMVITIDTAVAHLSGAMGKPTWILLRKSADWRWLLDRNDSPWYPTVRLFRQEQLDDWTAPINQVAEALAATFARRP